MLLSGISSFGSLPNLWTSNKNGAPHLRNEEFCFKVVGPAVKQVLERLVVHHQTHKLWDARDAFP